VRDARAARSSIGWGVVLITFGQGKGIGFDPYAWLIVMSALASSIYFVMQKPLLLRYTPLEVTTYTMWAGTVPMLVFAPGLVAALPHAPASATLSVLYLGVFPAAIAYLAWTAALAKTSASVTSSFLYVSPVLAILIAAVWIHEVPTTLSLVGGAIALAGVIVVNTLGRPAAPQLAEEFVEDPGR
jgi:drug/metabolite transporter (DMT)-like permease